MINQIANINNNYKQSQSEIIDKLNNQKAKITQNEVKINKHEKTLNLLTESNIKQLEKIKEHSIILNRHQDMLMNCIEYVKELYKEADELKYNLVEEDKKINELSIKNEAEIDEIRQQCKQGLDKVNEITNTLNKHTEILTQQSTTIAKVQAISYKNTERIDELCKLIFNHESRIKSLEGRVDKIEEILKRHEESILSLVEDVSEMKIQMNQVLERLKKLEERVEKIESRSIEDKADKIFEYLDKMTDDELYELAIFILELRGFKKPINLDRILSGIKIITGKKK